MANQGYIKLWRKIRNNHLWREERIFSRFEAFIDMLLSANGIDKTVEFRREQIPLKRGQLLTSEVQLSQRWNWSRNRVRRFLRAEQVVGTIEVEKRYNRFTVITLLNYATYNPGDTAGDTAEPKKRYSRRNITNKDINKDKERYKYEEIDKDLSLLLLEKILQNNPKSKVQDMTDKQREGWYNECRLMRENDRRTPEEIEAMINWSQQDSFWKVNIKSMGKLRIQFDQLWLKAQENDQFSGIKSWLNKSGDPF